jgi:hypothetical protein
MTLAVFIDLLLCLARSYGKDEANLQAPTPPPPSLSHDTTYRVEEVSQPRLQTGNGTDTLAVHALRFLVYHRLGRLRHSCGE